MIGPTEVAYGAIGGVGLGIVGMALFLVGLSAWDLHSRVKDDVPPHRHVWAVASHLPQHIYYGTDWRVTARITAYVAAIGGVFIPAGIVFGVGVAEVFLQ